MEKSPILLHVSTATSFAVLPLTSLSGHGLCRIRRWGNARSISGCADQVDGGRMPVSDHNQPYAAFLA